MQLKKMREILPRLYPGQVNDKNNSLTTSPKQSSEDKTNPSKGDGDQNRLYQGTEAENNKLSLINCIKCRNVQKISMQDIEKHKKLGWTEDKNFICKTCSHIPPPAFHFVPEGANAVDFEKHEKISSSRKQKTFKVKNFLPGKYYCDKCRFSTRDPLQYKKHIGQHEEIKFICSQCNYISYTKGEFQRHLVKHTGTFPYQCEYCEYGAVRHDYIVKHTRRVHEAPTKRPSNTIINHKRKKACLPSKSTLFEKQKYDEIPFQNKLSNSSSNMICEIPERVTKIVCSSHDTECSINATSVQDKRILEPSEISMCENQSVEVEVYSPKSEPLQPGMPLTVIAPSELVVPSNCLAQIVEIKIVNGAQQLVLKLIPMKEAAYKPVNCAEQELEYQGRERSVEGKKTSSVIQNELLTMEVNVDKLSSVSNQLNLESTHDKNSECLCSSDSQCLDYNSVSIQREDASKLRLHLVKGIDVHSSVAELCSQSLVTNSTEKKSDLKSSKWEVDGKNNLHYDLYCYEEGMDISRPKYATVSEDKSSKNISVKTTQEGKTFYSATVLKQKDTLPPKRDDKECKNLVVSSAEAHLTGKGFDKKSVTCSEAEKNFNFTKTPPWEDMTFGFRKVKKAETISPKTNLLLESLELQKMENKSSPFEGPVISSVFSLSSGAENVPEGIRWDDTTCNKKSATLLCRKIAQLMSAAESNMKSMPLRCQASSKKVHFPQENLASCERVVPATELEQAMSLPQMHGGNSVFSSEEHSNEQLLTFARTSKSRVTKNSNVATPVFIPKGTVLRVLNATSSQNSKGIEKRSEVSAPSMYCNEMLLPRPVPVSVSEKFSSNVPHLPNQIEPNAQSRNLSLRQRPRREASIKNSKQNGVPYQKSSDVSKQSKPYSRSQLGPKNKVKQASFRELPKRKTRTQSETSSNSDMSYLLTARRLRLVPLRMNQLIKCPRRNQPVVVLNHPDVDTPEIINVMKTINKYKGHVLKVVLSERTSSCLGVKRYRKRLTLQNAETGSQAKKQSMLKMKLKKTHKNNYQVVEASPAETLQCMFKCWFCGRVYVDQEEWISHGQRHLIEATKGWDVLSLPVKNH
ncbi:zinc finger protein 518B [Anas platyrhynchos]|uniref:zinc finger protein 518B n=1 Tax=Anas platyrhynchos TaxID=8839 RepID=UPI003AF27F28